MVPGRVRSGSAERLAWPAAPAAPRIEFVKVVFLRRRPRHHPELHATHRGLPLRRGRLAGEEADGRGCPGRHHPCRGPGRRRRAPLRHPPRPLHPRQGSARPAPAVAGRARTRRARCGLCHGFGARARVDDRTGCRRGHAGGAGCRREAAHRHRDRRRRPDVRGRHGGSSHRHLRWHGRAPWDAWPARLRPGRIQFSNAHRPGRRRPAVRQRRAELPHPGVRSGRQVRAQLRAPGRCPRRCASPEGRGGRSLRPHLRAGCGVARAADLRRRGRLLLPLGARGHEPGEFWLPVGLYIDREDGDTIYIADSFNRRVQVLRYVGGPN